MACPYCGQPMNTGSVRIGGLALYPSMCDLRWEPDDPAARKLRLSVARERRRGHFCYACGGIVIDPDT